MSRPGDSSESPTALALDPHPHSDGEKWREDVAALLAFVDEGDQVECVAFANGLKIYKRLAVCVYVQLRCGKVDLKSLTSLAEPLASWSSWDDITSLCKHDVIRAKLWELVQTNDAHNVTFGMGWLMCDTDVTSQRNLAPRLVILSQ
ncbi:hypothetical protein BD410DRAFT_104132 [Rickenella mellea]|uniref:Uncharacterized protein n=1 Tax=Rickenella mellea TaxID=50990 RepID=A0A4Y7PMB5_9AGAM|nr:hypothetical protein BD410DRAFT_104132 [Rickenella mellea]